MLRRTTLCSCSTDRIFTVFDVMILRAEAVKFSRKEQGKPLALYYNAGKSSYNQITLHDLYFSLFLRAHEHESMESTGLEDVTWK